MKNKNAIILLIVVLIIVVLVLIYFLYNSITGKFEFNNFNSVFQGENLNCIIEESYDIEEIENFGDVSDDVSDEVLSEMNYNSVVEAIRSLPENYAEPLYLYHVRDMSVKDIAASLCTSEETVKKRLQRARQKLRTILEEQGITL